MNLFNDKYIFILTDCTGMMQHSVYGVPDPSEGYTLDDNARALMMADMLYKKTGEEKYESLVYRYLSFLVYARKDGWFRNFCGYDRRFLEDFGSQDSFGRCIWALCYTATRDFLPPSVKDAARKLIEFVKPSIKKISCQHAVAYTLLGLSLIGGYEKEVKSLAEILCRSYPEGCGEWKWYGDKVTYCGAALPNSLLSAYFVLKDKKYLKIGLESLDFLLRNTFRGDIFLPVGSNGWFEKGKQPSVYDGQPVEACATLLACLSALRATARPEYLKYAGQCLNWYRGGNVSNTVMIDPATGGCYDGICKGFINKNEGAESIVSYAVSTLAIDDSGKQTGGDIL